MSSSDQPKMSQGLKTALELGPLLIFAVLTFTRDLQTAIIAFVILAPLAMAVTWYYERKIAPMQWVGTLLIVGLGLPSVLLDDPRLFKMKPTIASGLFAAALLFAWATKRMWIKAMMGDALKLPDAIWLRLTLQWGLFFLAMAIVNELAWRNLTDQGWATAKIGYFIASAVFGIAVMAPLVMKYADVSDDDKSGE